MDLEATRSAIIENLRKVYDPEISINIYDLGLIYKIDLDQMPLVNIEMTLTSAWCPSADDILMGVELGTKGIDGVEDCKIKVVWDPPWGPHMMGESAQLELNMFTDDMPWGNSW